MTVSKRDLGLLIGFLGIVAAVLCYFLYFQPTQEKITMLQDVNYTLEGRVSDLKGLDENSGTYSSETERMEIETASILSMMPVDVKEEDGILLALYQEVLSPMVIDVMTFQDPEIVDYESSLPAAKEEYTYEIAQVEALEAQNGEVDAPTTTTNVNGGDQLDLENVLWSKQMTYNYTVSYDGLKRSIQNLLAQTSRMSIDDVIVVFDPETGLLKGSTTISAYYIKQQDGKEYVQPDFTSVPIGTDNAFGAVEILSESDLEEGDAAAEADAE